jgi:hypothetical protein
MKKTILALVLAAGLTSFAGNAKADDYFNLMFIEAQLQQISASAENTIAAINANIASYSLSSLKQSYFTYNAAVGQLDADFGDFSNQLYSGYMNFQFSLQNVSNQIQSTSWDNSMFYMTALMNKDMKMAIGQSQFQQASVNLNGTQSSYQTSLQSHYASVPEPSTYALFGLGALALVVAYRRKVA